MKSSVVTGLAVLTVAILASGIARGAEAKNKEVPALPPEAVQKIEAAAPAKATVQPAKARRVLIMWRCEGFFHGNGIAGGNKAIEFMGRKTGAFETDITDDYGAFTPENLAKYDAVVLNNTTHLKFSDAQRKALLDYVNGGKGLVGIHAAADNFADWPDGAALVGGLFDGHPWGGGGTWAFKPDPAAKDHVLNRAWGGEGFKLKDEVYQFKDPYTRADRLVLATLDLSDAATAEPLPKAKRTDKDFAIAWAKTQGKGRVFFSNIGHAGNVFEDAKVLRFYLDGIQFAIGDLKAVVAPAK